MDREIWIKINWFRPWRQDERTPPIEGSGVDKESSSNRQEDRGFEHDGGREMKQLERRQVFSEWKLQGSQYQCKSDGVSAAEDPAQKIRQRL